MTQSNDVIQVVEVEESSRNKGTTVIEKVMPGSWTKMLFGALVGMAILFFIYIGRYQQTIDYHTELLAAHSSQITKIQEEIKNLPSITTSLNGIEKRLNRIEDKLDDLVK
jgi:hypothetical protein